MTDLVVDLFAGPGGWDQGVHDLGPDALGDRYLVGLEWDGPACETRSAAGWPTIRTDVAAYPTAPFVGRTDGLIASPPCQAFSLAGKGAGHRARERLLDAVLACRDGYRRPPETLCGEDVRADLTLEPLRWVDALRPRWVAMEQVPPVRDLWDATCHVLRAWGYAADSRVLLAADYGVPQTRRRAVLIARNDGRPVRWPDPTHHDGRKGDSLFGAPWVTMAEALGWEPGVVVDRRQTGAPVVTADDAPSPTVTGAAFGKGVWTLTRPATTIIGSSGGQVAAPGHRCMSDDCCGKGPRRHFTEDSIRVSVEEAGVLQSFPADYPWQGSQTARYLQVGNAIPPGLASAVLADLL